MQCRRALPALIPVGSERGELPPAAHPDDQVRSPSPRRSTSRARSCASRARPGRSSPGAAKAWGTVLADALRRYFKEVL
jgi:hypothetical protein